MTDLLTHLTSDERERVRRSDQPNWTEPMLATLTHDPFSDDGWIYERKLDGERCLVFREAGRTRLMSRNQKKLNDTYPELLEAVSRIEGHRFIVDGEIVAFEGDVTSFARLQQRLGVSDPDEARASNVKVYLYLFDLLHIDGYDVTALDQRSRKNLLRCLPGTDEPIRYTPHRNGDGLKYFREACDKGWEGLIAKHADARYQHGRSRDWLKFKCSNRQEFVIVGFTEPQGERVGFGALIIGYYQDGDLIYAGGVGTGFDDDFLKQWRKKLDRIERSSAPFDRAPSSADGDDVHWVTPEYVGEVAFTEWTDNGQLRHPRFIGMRDDKDAKEVQRERPKD
jgi:bifunctional non-homologous end joining protein LigD